MSESKTATSRGRRNRGVIIPGVSRRTDLVLDLRRSALVVIDIQKYLCPSPSSSSSSDIESKESLTHYSDHYQQQFPVVLASIAQLVEAFRTARDSTCDVEDGYAHTATTNACCCEVIFTYLQSQTMDRRDISVDYKLSGPLLANIPGPLVVDDDLFLPNCRPINSSPDHTSRTRGDLRLPKTSCDVFVSTNLDYLLRQLDIRHLVFVGQFTEQCVESAVRRAADLGYQGVVVEDACVCGSQQVHEDSLQRMRGYARVVTTLDLLSEIATTARPTTSRRLVPNSTYSTNAKDIP